MSETAAPKPGMDLAGLVSALSEAIAAADRAGPVAVSSRSGAAFRPGIGPHSESRTIDLALESWPGPLPSHRREVPYPAQPRTRCDLVLAGQPGWALELKMLRLIGDNGKPNDNMLMHILSPYPAHRSALTDCRKLLQSGFLERKGIVVFGYDYDDFPMDPAIDAFATLAARHVVLDAVPPAHFADLMHPVHRRGRVFGWEVTPRGDDAAGSTA